MRDASRVGSALCLSVFQAEHRAAFHSCDAAVYYTPGTRLMGGKDAASPRYVFTKLEVSRARPFLLCPACAVLSLSSCVSLPSFIPYLFLFFYYRRLPDASSTLTTTLSSTTLMTMVRLVCHQQLWRMPCCPQDIRSPESTALISISSPFPLGQSIEPTCYVPVIPMALVNGSDGIGTGKTLLSVCRK